MSDTTPWAVNEKLVLSELNRLGETIKSLEQKVGQFEVSVRSDLTALQVRSGLTGALAGFLAAMVPVLLLLIPRILALGAVASVKP